jgi:hypothetical protein
MDGFSCKAALSGSNNLYPYNILGRVAGLLLSGNPTKRIMENPLGPGL